MPLDADPFATAYARLWQELRHREWVAYAEDEPLDRAGIDRAIFETASRSDSVAASGIASTGDGGLVDRIRRRALVDHHPDVARLRDHLDDWSSYGPVPDRRTAAWRRGLAAAMEPDLVTLIRLRNDLARDLGTPSYGHLAMAAEGLDLDEVAGAMEELRAASLEEARTLATGAGLTIETWFDGLDRIAGPTSVDAVAEARELATRLGCRDLLGRIHWTVRDGPLAGWAATVSIPDDVRVVVRPAHSTRDLATVLHELGHALAYAGTRAAGIRAIPSDTQDEVMGVVLELIGVRLALPPAARARVRRVGVMEMARVTTSALFELAVQDQPERAREAFDAWYGPLVDVPDPVTWATDSFRSVDPFRIHAYALGARFGEAVVSRLESRFGDDPAAWGEWLRDKLWAPGRLDTFAELEALLP